MAERLVAAATVAIPTDQAPMARTIIDRDRTLLATFDAQIAEADKRLAAGAADPVRGVVPWPWLAGWSGLPPLAPRSATRHGGQRPPPLSGQRAMPDNLCLGRPPL